MSEGVGGAEVGVAYVTLAVSGKGIVSGIQSQIASAVPSASAGGASAGAAFGKNMLGMVKKFAPALGVALSVKGFYEIGQVWEASSNTIVKKTGASGAALQSLNKSVENVAKNSTASVKDITLAIADLSQRTGLSGKPLETMTSQYLKLSKITGTDLEGNITNLTRTFGAWNIKTKDQSGSLDKIYRASQLTGIGVDSLSQSLTKFAPALGQMGFSFTQSTALISQFEKTGVNTSGVLSAMKIGLANLSKAGEDPPKALARITAEIKNAGTSSKANKIAIETFGKKAGPELAAAIRSGKLSIGDLVKQLNSSQGSIAKTAKETRTISSVFALLKNKVLVGLKPVALGVLDGFTKMAFFFADKVVPVIERLAGIIKRNLEPVLRPIIALVQRIFAIKATGFSDFISKAGKELQKAGPGILKSLLALGKKFVEWILPLIPPMLRMMLKVILAIGTWIVKVALPYLAKHIVPWAKAFIAWILPMIPPLLLALLKVLYAIVKWILFTALPAILKALFQLQLQMWKAIGQAFLYIGKLIYSAWTSYIWPALSWLGGKIGSFFAAIPGAIWNALKTVGSFIARVFTGAWSAIWGALSWVGNKVVQYFKDLPGNFIQGLKNIGSLIAGVFTGAWTTIWNGLETLGKSIIDWFSGLPGNFAAAFTAAFKKIGGALGWLYNHTIGKVVNAVSGGGGGGNIDAIKMPAGATGGGGDDSVMPGPNGEKMTFSGMVSALVDQLKEKLFGAGGNGKRSSILEFASKFLGVPYVWGGTQPTGWDCSGFVGYVLQHFGIPSPRTAAQMQAYFPSESSPAAADLIFYGKPAHHVAMNIGKGMQIEAVSKGTSINPQWSEAHTYGKIPAYLRGGDVPGIGPQVSMLHGGEYVLTRGDTTLVNRLIGSLPAISSNSRLEAWMAKAVERIAALEETIKDETRRSIRLADAKG